MHVYRFMESNSPPSWLNQRPQDPGTGPVAQEAPWRGSPGLPRPQPPAMHQEIGYSQHPFDSRGSQVPYIGHGRSNEYLPTQAHTAPAWPSDTPPYRPALPDPPPSPSARKSCTWLPFAVCGPPTQHHDSNEEDQSNEDVALLLELQYVFLTLIEGINASGCAVRASCMFLFNDRVMLPWSMVAPDARFVLPRRAQHRVMPSTKTCPAPRRAQHQDVHVCIN
jgi:hypothetical protein